MPNNFIDIAEFENEEVTAFIKDLQKKLKKINGGEDEYVGLLSAIVYEDIIRHFEQQMGSGGPWAQWSPFYKEQMDKQGKGGNKILQDTGRLRNNFQPNSRRKVKNGILWFNNATTKGGFPYAAAHDIGGPILPKRDFMWLSKAGFDKIEIQTLQYLLEKGI